MGPSVMLWLTVKQATYLSVQELQCDVSVEEDSRQEWTFTLYDFDNNGKVTREVSVLPAQWQPSGTGLGLGLSLLQPSGTGLGLGLSLLSPHPA